MRWPYGSRSTIRAGVAEAQWIEDGPKDTVIVRLRGGRRRIRYRDRAAVAEPTAESRHPNCVGNESDEFGRHVMVERVTQVVVVFVECTCGT